jgi:hypothetical protein
MMISEGEMLQYEWVTPQTGASYEIPFAMPEHSSRAPKFFQEDWIVAPFAVHTEPLFLIGSRFVCFAFLCLFCVCLFVLHLFVCLRLIVCLFFDCLCGCLFACYFFVLYVCFSIVFSPWDYSLKVVDCVNGKTLSVLQQHQNKITCLSIAAHTFASGSAVRIEKNDA